MSGSHWFGWIGVLALVAFIVFAFRQGMKVPPRDHDGGDGGAGALGGGGAGSEHGGGHGGDAGHS
ncbi:MAG TPA: hypothetical protein VII40_03015 [Xanthobacteraceae bacterium]